MSPQPRHEVSELRHRAGELSFDAQIGDRRERVWLRTDSGEPTSAEAILPACLMPAMRHGGTLGLPVSISPILLRGQRKYQAIQHAWSFGWEFGEPSLQEVEVVAEASAPERSSPTGRVAAFLSGGVDSWSTVLDHPELTDLIFVRGFDLLLDVPHHAELVDEVESRLRGAAADLGLTLHVVETNLRSLSDPFVRWEAYNSCALAVVALFLSPRFDRVLITGEHDYEVQEPLGPGRLVDTLWSTENLEVEEAGGRYSRVERLSMIAGNPIVQRTLRVCWVNPDGAYNCGKCSKCLWVMILLEALGLRPQIQTFPPELDPEPFATMPVGWKGALVFREDILDAVREAGRGDLEPFVEASVEGGKRKYGLPADYQRRSRPRPPPLNATAQTRTPSAEETLREVLESRSWRLTAPLRRAGAALRRRRA
ncbi:MAG TPA: hypothetical protein VFZ41_03420 [Solirubrobacterales bacterium]